jgi:beta-galactosidase
MNWFRFVKIRPGSTQSSSRRRRKPTSSRFRPILEQLESRDLPSPVLAISAGGPATGSFVADTDYSGGTTYSNSDTLNTSKVSNPAPQSVYDHQRYGNFTYTIPNLTPGASYTVPLDFAEIYFSQAGQRTFNVSINGSQVLSNFDIYATAGGKDIAIAESFNTTANSSCQIVIQFTSVINNSLANGIEISTAGYDI